MPINFDEYIDVTSVIGGADVVATRELIGRLFSTNLLIPTNAILEFTSADVVGRYFGFTSNEYKRSANYFSYVGKQGDTCEKIGFARWTDTAQAPMIFGGKITASLASLQLITAGAFSLTLGTTTNLISGLDFSAAATLADVAEIIEDAIQAETGSGAQWTGATVTYNVTAGSFDFIGGSAVVAAVVVAVPGSGTDITTIIKWLNGAGGAIWSNGETAESLTTILTTSTAKSNNFGSFLFIPALTQDQQEEVGLWNSLQKNAFQFQTVVINTTAAAVSAALIDFPGIGMTLAPSNEEYPEQLPMKVLASTDYTAQDSTTSYEYQIDPTLTPSVTDTGDAQTYNALRVNYYGITQENGTQFAFYQQGVLTGNDALVPTDMNTYANEQWLRARAGQALMNMMLALNKISANASGIIQIISTLTSTVVKEALFNGTISVAKEITPTQKAYIKGVSGSATASDDVKNLGYWLGCKMVPVVVNGTTKYQAEYTLIYSKDDVIRKIVGTHILI